MDPLTAPWSFSHYRLIERIGSGAAGEVWLGEDSELARRVAVKLLHAHLAADQAAVARLMREARAVASVDHPNVVTVFETGIHDGRPFLVMQHLERETLEQRLRRGPLPVEEAIALTRDVADALAEVHALGIVHRDLKPSNIVLTPRGPKVLDFGIAVMRNSTRVTGTGLSPGTPQAMSPEQFRGQPADARSDLWALGVILHHALTGAPPFDGETLEAVGYQVLNAAPRPLSAVVGGVPRALDAVVARLLDKDPARRFARAEELIAALTSVTRGAPATPAEPPVPRLAVLYFDVLSPEADDAFLASGLTEDLIVDLARVGGLRITARGEVLPYRDRGLPPRTVARELGADYVVQGSVRRAGSRGRISAQLVRAADGHAVWADRFDRTLDDLFEVQAEVSKRIVEALQITLRPGEREMLDRAPTTNREAYAWYLRGRALGDEVRRESNRRAEACLREAIALDDRFALAHAALAECLANRCTFWWAGREAAGPVRAHARRALELDPLIPEAHIALGMMCRLEEDAAATRAEVEAVQAMHPEDPKILLWIGLSYMRLGRPEDAIPVLERGIALRPRDYMMLSAWVDCSTMLGREVTRGLTQIRSALVETLERQPDHVHARSMLAIVLAQEGERDAGVAQAERALATVNEDGRVRFNAACAFTYAGMPERAVQELRTLLEEHPFYVRDWMRIDPDLAPLRERPDFIELVGRPR